MRLLSIVTHATVGLLVWLAATRSPAEPGPTRLGTHVILELAGVEHDHLNNATLIPDVLRTAAAAASLTVLDELYHSFPVQGLSGLLLLAESHLSVHTWPEHGYAAFDLFTCGEPSPLPCGPRLTVRYDGTTWRCPDGRFAFDGAAPSHGLWASVSAIASALDAGGADLTWMDRGIPPRLLQSGGTVRPLAAHGTSDGPDEL